MLYPLLTSENCGACKSCCKFEPDELIDAPLFTTEIRDYILDLLGSDVQFIQKGTMWQIVLEKMPHKDKYFCPILDQNTGCKLGELRPFDCKTWPFYIMDFQGQLVITVSPSCQVMNQHSLGTLRNFAHESLADFMINSVRKNPELISPYHDNATILAVLGTKEDLGLFVK